MSHILLCAILIIKFSQYLVSFVLCKLYTYTGEFLGETNKKEVFHPVVKFLTKYR